MEYVSPTADDRPLWDLLFSPVLYRALTAADELGLFDALAQVPATLPELAERKGLSQRAVRALLPLLASTGLLVQRDGRYHLTETARNFLVSESAFYWGPVFALGRQVPLTHDSVLKALRKPDTAARWDQLDSENPTNAWSEGQIAPEVARAVAAFMHANCLPAAVVAARCAGLESTRKLLDVGAGSGCFSIAFAQAHAQLRCTLMDLQAMCVAATEYVKAAGLPDRIDTCSVDMFRQPWPSGHDAIFFSNIFHDWDFETCAMLARKAFEALPSGGRILVHEMLLDDTRDGPATAAAFSFYMFLTTKGQQFTASELRTLLVEAGFTEVKVTPAHGYYSIVSATKP